MLIFGQDGDPGSIERDMARMAEACEAEGATQVRIAGSEAEAADVLAARRAVLPALSRLEPLTILEDATVPRSRIAEMVARIQEIAEREGLMIGTFGHAGDGNLHPDLVLDRGDPRGEAITKAVQADLYRAALDLGGTVTGEHGIGSARREWLEEQRGPEAVRVMRAIKTALDPQGLLNPGRVLPE
jgi:glycolate oxidase